MSNTNNQLTLKWKQKNDYLSTHDIDTKNLTVNEISPECNKCKSDVFIDNEKQNNYPLCLFKERYIVLKKIFGMDPAVYKN